MSAPTHGMRLDVLAPADHPPRRRRVVLVGVARNDDPRVALFATPLDESSRMFPASDDEPAMVAVAQGGPQHRSVHLRPASWDDSRAVWVAARDVTAGYHYAALGDSRTYAAIRDALRGHFYGALAIHDSPAF